MIVSRIREQAKDQNWVSVVLDLLIVAVGLYFGLQADAWWQNLQDSRQERIYLTELQEDFVLNEEIIDIALENGDLIIRDMIALMEQTQLESPDLPVEQLDEHLSSLQTMPTVLPISRAYDNLTGSGELSVLRNREIKNGLADYYSYAKVIELVQSTHEMQLVQTFQPYLSENTEFGRVLISWQEDDEYSLPEPPSESGVLELINTRDFRNIVTEKYYSARDLYDLHDGLKEINDELVALLQTALSN